MLAKRRPNLTQQRECQSAASDDNWTFLSTLHRLPESIDRRLVMTTVNKRVMEQTAGRTDAVEVIGGHADDFEPLVEVFRRTLRDAYGGAWPPAEENGKKLRRRSAE